MCSETKSSQHTSVKPVIRREKRLKALSEAGGRCVVGFGTWQHIWWMKNGSRGMMVQGV